MPVLDSWIVTSHLNWEERKNDLDVESLNKFLGKLRPARIGFFGDVNNYLDSLMHGGEIKNFVKKEHRTFINDEIRCLRSIDFVGFTGDHDHVIEILDEFPEDQSVNIALDKPKRILHAGRGIGGIAKLWDHPSNRCENASDDKQHVCTHCICGFNHPRIFGGHLSDHSLIRLDINGRSFLQYNILAAVKACAEYYEDETEQPWVMSQERISQICNRLVREDADFICLQEVDEKSRETITNHSVIKSTYSYVYAEHYGRDDGLMILSKNIYKIGEANQVNLVGRQKCFSCEDHIAISPILTHTTNLQ